MFRCCWVTIRVGNKRNWRRSLPHLVPGRTRVAHVGGRARFAVCVVASQLACIVGVHYNLKVLTKMKRTNKQNIVLKGGRGYRGTLRLKITIGPNLAK